MKTLFDQDITLDEAEKLVKNGANVNEKDEFSDTPLHFVRNVHIVKLLIDNGADVNAHDLHGYTPLFL